MIHSFRIYLYVLVILGMMSTGCRTKHSDESVHRVEINQVDSSGNKQGPWEIYEEGVLIARGTYVDGKPDGLWTYWYPHGQMKEEGHYHLGIKCGMWVEWYPDGELMWKGEWENGKRNMGYPGSKAEITFLEELPQDNVLTPNHIYHFNVRIQNVPVDHLFVEANNSVITREAGTDSFILSTSFDSTITLAIGYIPDLEFKDFKNLVREITFEIK
jgi:hypothetical protein